MLSEFSGIPSRIYSDLMNSANSQTEKKMYFLFLCNCIYYVKSIDSESYFLIFLLITYLENLCAADMYISMYCIFQPHTIHLVPPVMVMLAKHPKVSEYDLSSVKRIFCGAAPLSAEIEEAVKRRLNLRYIHQGKHLLAGKTARVKTVSVSLQKKSILKRKNAYPE